MPQLTFIDYAFWFASPALQAVLAAVMYRRHLQREFPMFFNYTVFQVLCHIFMFVAWRWSSDVYFYAYCTTSALGIGLGFCVIREVFLDAFRPFEAIRELGVVLFRWSVLVLLLIAAATAIVAPHANNTPDIIYAGIITLERSIRVMQFGLVLFMVLFSNYLGVTKRHYLFGIALGFGTFATTHMIVLTLRVYPGLLSGATASRFTAAAYFVSVLIWLGYTLAPQAERRKVEILPQSERWNHTLANVLNVPVSEGFLPNMERTVERLLQQQHPTEDHHNSY
ncbi:MAG TPA: hypothetical protein VN622_18180 [Clostridia bacterium]|nr:hypothetical protein [Clostridia bacterium]